MSSVVSSNTSAASDHDPSQNQDYMDALEDVHTRFILNLPPTELETADRIFFQLEQAWWFYEDWICDQNPDKDLPRFGHLRPFALRLFEYSPLLPPPNGFSAMWNEFAQYKRKISNYGCILLNKDCTKVVLCQVWNGKTFMFPSGKINQGETGIEAATRETYEETGFDPHCNFGKTKGLVDVKWNFPLREQDALSYQESNEGKRRTCYVCAGVPEDFPFAPVARKEVSKVAWYPLDNLPKPNFAITPFLTQLKRWIQKHQRGGHHKKSKKKDKSRERAGKSRERAGKKGEQQQQQQHAPPHRRTPNRSRQNSRQRVREHDDLVNSGLAEAGDVSGWSEEDMFKVNEQLLGRKVEYDGNPHQFEQGFGGRDPHSFRVVGGSFLNSDCPVSSLAPPPESSKLQPLFQSKDRDEELQPFFTDQGETPWGDVVAAAKADSLPRGKPGSGGQGGGHSPKRADRPISSRERPTQASNTVDRGHDAIFLTDAEITAQSQAQKTSSSSAVQAEERRRRQQQQYQDDMEYIRQWVAKLPKPMATPHFGKFSLDAEAIVAKAMQNL